MIHAYLHNNAVKNSRAVAADARDVSLGPRVLRRYVCGCNGGDDGVQLLTCLAFHISSAVKTRVMHDDACVSGRCARKWSMLKRVFGVREGSSPLLPALSATRTQSNAEMVLRPVRHLIEISAHAQTPQLYGAAHCLVSE